MISWATPSSSPPTTPISTSRMIFALAVCVEQLRGDRRGSRRGRSPSRPTCGTGTAAPGRRTTRSWDSAISGRTKPSSLSFGQWSVCSAMLTGYFAATTWANSASATDPVTMSLTLVPEANSDAAGGDLDDAVALGLGEAPQRGVERLGRGHVDGGKCELVRLRPVQHLGVDLGCGDGHRYVLLGAGQGRRPDPTSTRAGAESAGNARFHLSNAQFAAVGDSLRCSARRPRDVRGRQREGENRSAQEDCHHASPRRRWPRGRPSRSPAPASADDGWLCTTRDATPVYASMSNGNYDGYLFTLSPGRGFRAYSVEASVVEDTVIWSAHYGHGAERPDRNGYVRSEPPARGETAVRKKIVTGIAATALAAGRRSSSRTRPAPTTATCAPPRTRRRSTRR